MNEDLKIKAIAAVSSGTFTADEWIASLGIDPKVYHSNFEKNQQEERENQERYAAWLSSPEGQAKIAADKKQAEEWEAKQEAEKTEKRRAGTKKAAATRKANKKSKTAEQQQLFNNSAETLSYVAGLREIKKKNNIQNWQGISVIPPGSLLDDIIQEFHKGTSLPLEIPFMLFFHLIAGYLLIKDVVIQYRNQKMYCDFWTILLAPSSSGKTWTMNRFKDFLPEINNIIFEITAAGSASFIQELGKHRRGLWTADEILQLLQQIDNPNGAHGETKGYLLRLYDNATLERSTKEEVIKVENPAIAIIGLNTPETFMSGMSPASLTDGFAQRPAYILAQPEPENSIRNWRKMPEWFVDTTGWAEKWKRMTENLQNLYTVSESGMEAYKKIFLSYSKNATVPESFFRRILWKLHKYALVYHLITFNTAEQLTEGDYFWAQRLIERQLSDAYKIIDSSSQGRLGRLLDKSEEWINRTIAEGKIPTARNLTRNFSHDIKSVSEAESILKMLYHGQSLKPVKPLDNTNVVGIKTA